MLTWPLLERQSEAAWCISTLYYTHMLLFPPRLPLIHILLCCICFSCVLSYAPFRFCAMPSSIVSCLGIHLYRHIDCISSCTLLVSITYTVLSDYCCPQSCTPISTCHTEGTYMLLTLLDIILTLPIVPAHLLQVNIPVLHSHLCMPY